MTHYDSILSAATRLSMDERLRLIDDLYASVPEVIREVLKVEWKTVIDKREIKAEVAPLFPVPWAEVRKEIGLRVGLEEPLNSFHNPFPNGHLD